MELSHDVGLASPAGLAHDLVVRGALLGLLLLLGCQDSAPLVVLVPDLPPEVSLVSVLVLDEGGRVIESTGLVGRQGAPSIALSAAADASNQILLVAYSDEELDPSLRPDDETLLGAPLYIADADAPRLPAPLFFARGPAGEQISLAPTPLDLNLSARWVAPCARVACDRFRFGALRTVPIPGERRDVLRSTLPWADHREVLLVSTSTPAVVYRFRPPAQLEAVSPPLSGGRPRFMRGLVDGRVAVLLDTGPLWLGMPERDFELQVGPVIQARMPGLGAATFGDELELHAQDEYSNVYVLEGDGWRRLWDLGLPSTGNQWLEWLGPSELVAIASAGERIQHIVGQQIVSEHRTTNARLVRPIEGLGALIPAGTALSAFESGIYVWTPSSFEPLPVPIGNRTPEGLWASPGAREFFFGGANGELHFYAHGLGACGMPAWTGEAILNVTWLVDGLLLAPRRSAVHEGDFELLYVPFAEPPRPQCDQAYRRVSR